MRVAVVGSRGLTVENLGDYIPKEAVEIVSGGAMPAQENTPCGTA